MDYGIISCIPIAVLIIGILITKKMVEMVILSSVIGAVLVYRGDFLSGYIELLYGALSNSSYQFIAILLLGFGGVIKLFEKSGALLGFSDILAKLAKGPKSSMVLTWIMGVVMFVDDYLNVLAVSVSTRGLTDRNGVPREHLAYAINSMGASVCVLFPVTTWAAFAIGCMSQEGLGYADYVRAIPFMFFPLAAILICLLVAAGVLPKVGPIKKAYQRVEEGGPVLLEEKTGTSIVKLEVSEDVKPSTPLNFILPIAVLIAVMLIFDNDVIHGLIAAIVVQGILYLGQKRMTLTQFLDTFFEGAASMLNLAIVICFTFVLSGANDAMGFSQYLVDTLTGAIPATLLPVLTFLIVGFVAFAAASFWVLVVLTIPVFVPLAMSLGVDPAIVCAAIMSGVAFGSKFCFYSDAVFMTSAGTGISNMSVIRASAPYVLSAAVLAAILFLITGLVVA